MPLQEGQVQIRDLVMGPGTPFEILRYFNPWDREVRADQGGPRPWAHGSWSGAEWMNEVIVPFPVKVDGNGSKSEWLQRRFELQAAFAPIGDSIEEIEMRFNFGGTEYVMYGRPRVVNMDMTLMVSRITVANCAFVALNPLIFASEPTVLGPINLPVMVGGLTVPFTVPLTIDSVLTGGSLSITNEGTAETFMVITITGPVEEPRVVMKLEDGTIQTLEIDTKLLTGQTLTINTATRTVMLNDTISQLGNAIGTFPTLPAGGPHEMLFRAGEYNANAELSVSFTKVWW
jgi:hypothetical protein